MWGHIMTEASTITNFNFGFSTYKSDVLIHLSQWQYWWWFWFSLFWGLYFYIIYRVVNRRVMHYNPVANTSLRGHGKWGDFLVAIIPLSWCGNILVNSNFILRMIEWQNEGSLFTLRIQGKQWYWVYKFEAAGFQNIIAAPKNIGNNNWQTHIPNESYTNNTYYATLQLGTQLEYKQRYLKFLAEDNLTKKVINEGSNTANPVYFQNVDNFYFKKNLESFITSKNIKSVQPMTEDLYKNFLKLNWIKQRVKHRTNISGFYNYNIIDDTSDFSANLVESNKKNPLTLLLSNLNKHTLTLLNNQHTLEKPILFIVKFWKNKGTLEPKVEDSELLWGFKQKKYKRLQKFKFLPQVTYNSKTFLKNLNTKKNPFTLKSEMLIVPTETLTKDNTEFTDMPVDLFNYQNAIKFNRHRSELVPVTLARRLLRTKRTLVLPAHVNLTIVTNSYDVVHSWFIPGLGLKLDCVPGRSTHHSFYIDNVGFYYGQCAEICGRYHHHMPIRMCALPFEQFLIWWQRRGVKRLHRVSILNNSKKFIDPKNIKFRYNW